MAGILLTGYEAFANTPVNPAEAVARRLDGAVIGGVAVTSCIVPNTFFKAIDTVTQAMAQLKPEVVVMMGEFGGRAMVTVERIAQNFNDGARYGLRDNDGKLLQGELTVQGGPAAHVTTLPLRAMVKAMRSAGIPADISDAAGTFCCNHLMYGVLHHIETERMDVRAGWVHLPHLPEVAALDANIGAPSMPLETAAEGVSIALAAILEHPNDITDPLMSRLQV